MSYQGLEMTSQQDYIFSDTIPYNPDFDLEELKAIQTKIEDFTSGRSFDGITSHEAEVLLDWVTFNARNYAVKNGPESPMTATMTGQCAPTQRVNVKLLTRMGLDARPFNTADCIGKTAMNAEDIDRVQRGWSSPAVRHSVSLVSIPIIDNNGNTAMYPFLLDPTFRQFCLRENCNGNKFVDQNWLSHGHVAPHPGYFMEADNLRQLGVSEETAQKTEGLGKLIVSRGYFYLSDENAKLYGDTFVRASERLEFQNRTIYTSGMEYINNFANIPMHIIENDREDMRFTQLPSEIAEQKQGVFSRIKNFFKERFWNKQKMLPVGNDIQKVETATRPKIEGVTLTPEQYEQFRTGETQVLNSYNQNQYQYGNQTIVKEDNEIYYE